MFLVILESSPWLSEDFKPNLPKAGWQKTASGQTEVRKDIREIKLEDQIDLELEREGKVTYNSLQWDREMGHIQEQHSFADCNATELLVTMLPVKQ